MLASGSKDNSIKLWDPRQQREITSLYPHKNTVTVLRWHPAGNHVLSGSRDNLLKLFDLRTMREQATFKHHKREVSAPAYDPPSSIASIFRLPSSISPLTSHLLPTPYR